jgi:hypothetical protein
MVIVGPAYWNDPGPRATVALAAKRPAAHRNCSLNSPIRVQIGFRKALCGRGQKWGTDQEGDDIRVDFEKVALWARQNERPI